MTEISKPWRERMTYDDNGVLRVDGELPDQATYNTAKRGVLDEAHALDAEVKRLRAAVRIVNRHDLPDGVELHRDGSLWALGRDIPDGWERRVVDGSKWYSRPYAACSEAWYEVRPPQPQTERVPWWEALRDRRKLADSAFMCDFTHLDSDTMVRVVGLSGYDDDHVTVDADGTVEVLP